MASIHRHSSGRSPFWFGKFIGKDGLSVVKSTKQTDRNKAMTIALEWERAAGRAKEGNLTKEQCWKVLAELLEKTAEDTIDRPTARAYFTAWLETVEVNKSETTHAKYRGVAKLFLDHLGTKADRRLENIRTDDVQGFLNQRRKNGSATKTVSVDAKTLSVAFRRAVHTKVIPTNPMIGIDLERVISSRRSPFSVAQVAMILAAAPSVDWKTLILLGYHTSARLSDCKSMTWANVDLAHGAIHYFQRKSRNQSDPEEVVAPLHPDLERHLMALASTDEPGEFLCPSLAQKDAGGAHGLSATFKQIMQSAGIDCQTGAGKGDRQFSKLTFHSLRKTCNSSLANAGVNQEIRMKLTGHKSKEVNDIYTSYEFQTLKDAVIKVPSVLSARQTGRK